MNNKIIAVFIVLILLAGTVPFSQNATAQQNPVFFSADNT